MGRWPGLHYFAPLGLKNLRRVGPPPIRFAQDGLLGLKTDSEVFGRELIDSIGTVVQGDIPSGKRLFADTNQFGEKPVIR
jgi:hypothetical protein